MKSRSKELQDRAISAMVAAIEIYNKPGFPYRTESFAILAINPNIISELDKHYKKAAVRREK